jgi:cytochrome c-type biogenesis protein CcsB
VTVVMHYSYERVRERLPPAALLDAVSYTIITIGFPLMTMVIITGAVWAKKSFGHYWQWDPKETASLICWLIYTLYLHARVSLNWSERSLAVIAIIGFASVVFTYLGVNVIGPGYHAYASF